ncbi:MULTISPECIES: LPXTG cell wall anchor domain-containing protein [unclassified Streptomyces]|uniref:LPXTG cell wall anchor domain-containing protein n=1 Tax=unclassified Streptomyces TaxID=2593676 RepID=UPI001CBAFEBC|nr:MULTISPECIES: LPXTG cell wall anchor domain-containing protein [unclassified Streptomyces]WPO75882.1 LPXTG cell wall anchor domain-containing protein [Streptomyces sp. KN37]
MLTATAAGALLGALWFVPSANATSAGSHDTPRDDRPANSAPHHDATATATTGRLADTGSFDTTPYVAGGTAFLGLGAGFVAYSVRRERSGQARGAAF